MRTSFGWSLLIICVLSPALVVSQSAPQGKKFASRGVVEIAGSVSFTSVTMVSNGETGDPTSLFSLGPQIAYFPIDGLSIGFNPGIALLPGISIVSPDEGDNTTVLQLFFSPAYNYLLESGSVALFAEVPLGYTSLTSGDNTASGFSWGVKGGLKVVATGNVLITFFGEYLLLTLNPENSTTERDGFNYLSFGVGIGGFF